MDLDAVLAEAGVTGFDGWLAEIGHRKAPFTIRRAASDDEATAWYLLHKAQRTWSIALRRLSLWVVGLAASIISRSHGWLGTRTNSMLDNFGNEIDVMCSQSRTLD